VLFVTMTGTAPTARIGRRDHIDLVRTDIVHVCRLAIDCYGRRRQVGRAVLPLTKSAWSRCAWLRPVHFRDRSETLRVAIPARKARRRLTDSPWSK